MVRGEAGWVVEGGGVPSGIEYVVAGEAQLEIKPRNGFGSSREEGGAYWGFEGTTGGGVLTENQAASMLIERDAHDWGGDTGKNLVAEDVARSHGVHVSQVKAVWSNRKFPEERGDGKSEGVVSGWKTDAIPVLYVNDFSDMRPRGEKQGASSCAPGSCLTD